MGAPKQKWTAEEESALKAGVKKHGSGKWRNILRDPEFSRELRLRSNIDLKDKWRNMNLTGSGSSVSKERAKLANKKSRRLSKSKKLEDVEYNPMATTSKLENDMVMDVIPIASSSVSLGIESKEIKKPLTRLNNLILDAVTQLHVHEKSDSTSIALYIEEKYQVSSDFQLLLSAKLKSLVNSGKLIKVNKNYKLAAGSAALQVPTPRLPLPVTRNDEIRKEKAMEAAAMQEAADSAARAVAEAEIAESEAEEAIRNAEKFEAEAQETQAFVETIILHLKNRNSAPLMIHA